MSTMIARVALSILLVPGLLQPPAMSAREAPPPCTELPRNLVVSPFLQPVVATMLRKSPTFRRQCGIISAAPHVRVRVTAVWLPPDAGFLRARATIRRYIHGLLCAEIELPMIGEHVELLAHELEHVVEQIEGLDLEALAGAGNRGVTRTDAGRFETTRARRAGITAWEEVCTRTTPASAPPRRGAHHGRARTF